MLTTLRHITLWSSTALLALSSATLRGQDFYLSQFHEAPMLRSPALAGVFSGDYRIQGVYRNQWNSISYPYQTGSLNIERKATFFESDDFITLGLQLFYDQAGAVRLTSGHLLPVVNFHKSLSERRSSFLSLGFFGGLVTRRLDRSRVTTNNQFDGIGFNSSLPDGETFTASYAYFDAGVGLSYNTTLGMGEKHILFLGSSYQHFNRPINAFYRNIRHLPKWVFSTGFRIQITDINYITFHGDHILQAPYQQTIFGGLYSRRIGGIGSTTVVHLGLFGRLRDAVIPMFKIDLEPVRIGFSYDVTVGNLVAIARSRGGFELSMSYAGFSNRDNSVKYATRCPKF